LIGKNSIVERVLEGHLSVILRRLFGSQGENRGRGYLITKRLEFCKEVWIGPSKEKLK
jgi:hypothetical protein